MIVSVNRVAHHLEHSEGRKEESRIIRDFFTQEPIQKAIEAAAVHHSSQVCYFCFSFLNLFMCIFLINCI